MDVTYGLTTKGRVAPIKNTTHGQVLQWLQTAGSNVNPHEAAYELQLPASEVLNILEDLMKAGYVWKESDENTYRHPLFG